jgi:hypothetical protein
MTALTADFNRATKAWLHVTEKFLLKASTLVYQGALVATEFSTGYLVNAANTAGLKVAGISEGHYDNSSGADGAAEGDVTIGDLAKFSASGATQDWVGKIVYVVDNDTVALVDPGNGVKAGVCMIVESADCVWIWVGVEKALPGEIKSLSVYIADVSTASERFIVSPYAGDIIAITSVLEGTIATADATLSSTIGGVAIADGNIVIEDSGSAAGDIDSATPSAANTVAVGNYISVATDGASTNAVGVMVTFTIKEA